MRLLVLGGTRFVGRHLVAAALERGHEVTLVHRGLTNPDLFPDAERLLGDRGGDLSFLAGRRWDAAIDVNGYVPRIVRAAAERLAGTVDLYAFISTLSVYADLAPGADEEWPLRSPPPGSGADAAEVTDDSYGWMKAACEAAVAAALPDRALIVRPGLMVGPHDFSARFSYWVWRLARGGEVLAPAEPGRPVQLLDARDLGEWIVRRVEAGATGVCNATGPDRPLTLGEVLTTCADIARKDAGKDATLTWVDEGFLLEHGAEPWTGLPLWLPAGSTGFFRVDNRRARAAGLTFRPLADTIRDTLAWLAEGGGVLPVPADRPGPLSAGHEAELLRAWHGGHARPS
jgi:2'-hydroxyisoflavone reductase